MRQEILTLVVTFALAIISGYTVEEAARAGRDRSTMKPEEIRELIKDVLNGMVDELSNAIITAQTARAEDIRKKE